MVPTFALTRPDAAFDQSDLLSSNPRPEAMTQIRLPLLIVAVVPEGTLQATSRTLGPRRESQGRLCLGYEIALEQYLGWRAGD